MTRVISNVACTRCGCVCDDLTVTVAENRIVDFTPDCSLASEWFNWLRDQPEVPAALIDGRPAEMDAAIQHAAEILDKSSLPLIFGLSRSSTDGQRKACELADKLGAVIDSTASRGHGPSILAFQAAGESTSTLGEVRHRADLVIYWNSDPLYSHPRHLERFVESPGQHFPNGRHGRHVVVVDNRPTKTSAAADTFLQIPRGSDFEVLSLLRCLIRGIPIAPEQFDGLPEEGIRGLAERMRLCQFGAIFFGIRLAAAGNGHASVEALLRLGTELNDYTRFVVRRMRVPGDVTGADSVLCWQTGYPFSISLSRGYPRYGPGEYSAENLLERGEADSVVLVGGERISRLSEAAQKHLQRVPVILLDPAGLNWDVQPQVRFHTAVYGIHCRATAYRMDEVPVPLRKILDSPLPTDHEILDRLIGCVSGAPG